MKFLFMLVALASLLNQRAGQPPPAQPSAVPDNVDVRRDIVYCNGGGRDLKLDLFLPKGRSGRRPGVIFIHGGGWRGGTRRQFHPQAAHLATTLGYVGAAIEYRLSGEATFPAAVEDVKCAVRWLRAEAQTYGVVPERIAAVGGSAGAHLAAMLGVTDRSAGLEGDGGHGGMPSRVNAVVAFNGSFDLAKEAGTETAGRPITAFLGGSAAERPEIYQRASPITYVSPAAAPFLLLHGTADTTVSIEQSRMMMDRLRDAGVKAEMFEAEGAAHGFFNRPPHYQPALDRMVAFLRAQFEGTSAASDRGSAPRTRRR